MRIDARDAAVLKSLYAATNGDGWDNTTGWGNLSSVSCDEVYGVACEPEKGRVVQLQLAGNQLAGRIPRSLGNLTALILLHLGSNSLTGTLPASLGDCSALQAIHLDHNQFTGTLPTAWRYWQALEIMELHVNGLTSTIPSELFRNCSAALWRVDLSQNALSGSIPNTLGDCHAIQNLFLYGNPLTGTVRVYPPPPPFSQPQPSRIERARMQW